MSVSIATLGMFGGCCGRGGGGAPPYRQNDDEPVRPTAFVHNVEQTTLYKESKLANIKVTLKDDGGL